MSDLQDAITFLEHKIKFEPSMSGTYHMTSQVLTGDEYQTIQRALEAARLVANAPPEALTVLDGYPDLYEFSLKQVEALETLGVKMFPVKNEYIVQNVLVGLAALTPGDPDE